MWLGFDTCSSYAWSKIIKQGCICLVKRLPGSLGQPGFGGTVSSTGGYLAGRGSRCDLQRHFREDILVASPL